MEGQKYDNDKLPIFTVLVKQFPDAIKEVVKCSKVGHNKYPNDTDYMNFKRVDISDNPYRYLEAAQRHLFESGGELTIDIETIKYGSAIHLAQAAWNILAHLQIRLENNNL